MTSHKTAVSVSLLLIFLALGLFYVGLVPLWESPDEPSHFSHAYFLLRHRSLPRPGTVLFEDVQLYEARHPPLYYAIAATFMGLWERAGLPSDVEITPNPDAACTPERNRFEHPEGLGWFAGSTLAYATRFLSLCIAAVGPLLTALLAARMFPSRPGVAVLSFLLHGCFPQFLFVSSSVNNDSLTQTLSAGILYVLCGLLLAAETPSRSAVWGGTLVAACIATKASGLVWVPLSLGAVLLLPRKRVRAAAALVGPAVACGIILFFLTSMKHGGGGLPESLHRRLFSGQGPVFSLSALGTVPESLWACFGWVDVCPAPHTNARVTVLVAALLAVGWFSLWRNGELRGMSARSIALVGLVPLVFLISIGLYTSPLGKAQGRFLFPAMGALAIVGAYALTEMSLPLGRRGPWVAVACTAALLGTTDVWCVYKVILPTYRYQLPPGLVPGTRQCNSNAITFPIVPLQEQGQAFTASHDSLTRIDVRLATHRRKNTGRLNLQLCRGTPPETGPPIRTVVEEMSSIRDNEYHAFTFQPVPGSERSRFYFYLEAPGASAVNAISARMYDRKLVAAPGVGSRYRRHTVVPGALCFTTYYAGAPAGRP
jgi:hypothetical protein